MPTTGVSGVFGNSRPCSGVSNFPHSVSRCHSGTQAGTSANNWYPVCPVIEAQGSLLSELGIVIFYVCYG